MKVGIIGAGIISESHVTAISRHEDLSLQAVSEINPERRQWCRHNWTPNVYEDYREMLSHEQFDLVINCLPHALHLPATLDVLSAGIHTLVEKPLAKTYEDCRQMIVLAESKGLIIAPGHVIRYFPAVARVKRWMESEDFGDLLMISAVRDHTNYFTRGLPQWFKSKEMAGGGILMMTGSHSIDTLQWYAGSRVASVRAHVTRTPAAPEVEACVQAFLVLENGVTATLKQSGIKTFNQVTTELTFTNGMIQSATFADEIKALKGDDQITPPPFERCDPFHEQLDVVYKAIKKGTALDVTAEYSAHIVRTIQAIYRSADEDREVRVDEIEE